MGKKFYTIFVNFNSGKQLYEGVLAILKLPVVTGIIVVDNGSNDDSLKFLDDIKGKDRIIIIKNKENLGFYKALNVAFRRAFNLNADMVMPLDFDLNFDFDFITKLTRVNADIVAPAIKLKQDGEWFFDYGGRIKWIKGSTYHLIKKNLIKNIGQQTASIDKSNPYWFDYVSGGCTVIKRSVIEKIGYFDEDYFVYWGDTDYALRARDAGLKVVMDGTTVVHHKYEIARQTLNFNKLKISFFDNLTFIRKRVKWYFKPFAYLNIFLLSVGIFLTAARIFLFRILKRYMITVRI